MLEAHFGDEAVPLAQRAARAFRRDARRFRILQRRGGRANAQASASAAVANAAPRRMRVLAGVIAWRIDRC